MKKSLKVIRFEINNPNSSDVNRLPKGIQGDKSLMMWKELCRTGHYETDGESHNITLEFFQNMIHSFRERIAKGVEVPCPKGHNHDPENKRGRVRYLEIRSNDSGGYSLWGIIEFIDPQAKRSLMNSDVSIDSPEELCDGDGTTYRYALEHVAFTDYPVVAGMEGFKDVKFSVIKERLNERWNIDLLLNKLGLVGDYGTPSDAYQAIYDKFCAITGKPRTVENKQSGRGGRDSEEVGEEENGERRMSKRKKFSDDELDFEELNSEQVDFDGEEDDGNMLEMACRKKFGKKKFGDDEIDDEFSEDGDDEFSEDEDDEEFGLDEDDEEFGLDDEEDTELDLDGEDEEFSEDEDDEFGLEDDEEEFGLDEEEDEFDLDEGDDEFSEDEDDEFDLDEEEEFDLDDTEDEFGLDDDEEEEALGMSTRRRKMSRRRYGKRFSLESSRLIRENRSMKIDNLRRGGYINAQQSNELKRQFCKNGVSFSRDSEGEFERLIAFAKRGPRTSYRERTGIQFSQRRETNALEQAIGNLYGGKNK